MRTALRRRPSRSPPRRARDRAADARAIRTAARAYARELAAYRAIGCVDEPTLDELLESLESVTADDVEMLELLAEQPR